MDDRYLQIRKLQETLYLGNWNTDILIKTLDAKIEDCYDNSQSLLEVIYILKIFKEVRDPSIVERLVSIIESHTNFWVEDAGISIIVEILDVIISFKRTQDIDYLTSMISWDLFQIPSQILLLIRRYGWTDLWNNIVSEYDLSVEYDIFIHRQFNETKDVVDTFSDVHFAPVVYVEGKTDEEIMNTAWQRLYIDKTMPFNIKACDPLSSNVSGGSGGVGTLSKFISTIRSDSLHLAIAVFDRDKEGIDAYNNLPGLFEEDPSLNAKITKHRRAAALLLPIPPGKDKYAEYLNLSIEFYFSDPSLLSKSEEGFSLQFRYPKLETRVKRHGNPIIEIKDSDIPETREVISGKTTFAEKIVPKLDTSEFDAFRALFKNIEKVIDYLASSQK